jgi:hypothetical protein
VTRIETVPDEAAFDASDGRARARDLRVRFAGGRRGTTAGTSDLETAEPVVADYLSKLGAAQLAQRVRGIGAAWATPAFWRGSNPRAEAGSGGGPEFDQQVMPHSFERDRTIAGRIGGEGVVNWIRLPCFPFPLSSG